MQIYTKYHNFVPQFSKIYIVKITKILIENLIKLSKGRPVSFSMSKNEVFGELLAEGVVKHVKRGCHNSIYAVEPETFSDYIAKRYDKLENLENLLRYFDDVNSKSQSMVAWKPQTNGDGARIYFVSDKTIKTQISATEYLVQPCNGVETSILASCNFVIDPDVTIVGIISKEIFDNISKFYSFFGSEPHLYIYSADFVNVAALVKANQCRYIHFGNLDFEEIERYESMIYNEIGERAEFFFPENMREFIKKGNIKQFKEQYRKYRNAKVKDQRLKPLRMLLIQHQRAFNMNGYLPL